MSVFHSVLFRQQALIAGSWRDAADGTTLAVSNPSTGATLGQIPNMGRAEAQQAVDAAAAALPDWRAFTAAQRAGLPRRLADGAIAKKQRRLFIHRLRVIAFSLALMVFLAGVFVINWQPGPDT